MVESQVDLGRFLKQRNGFKRFEGAEPGPTSIVLAGVHGNERGGIEAFERIAPHLVVERGEVWLGYGNPRAIRAGERQIEVNLNRMFQSADRLSEDEKASYERRRALRVMRYLDAADTLLDVHGTRNPVSPPFVIAEQNGMAIAQYLPVELVVSGFDEFEPGGTDYYMNTHKDEKTGICIECGFNEDPKTTDRAEEAILAFLGAQELVDRDLLAKRKKGYRVYFVYKPQERFDRTRTFVDFEEVQEGEQIGTDGKIPVTAPQEGVVLFANRDNVQPGDEAFLLARTAPEMTVFDASEAPNVTPPAAHI